MGVAFIFRVYIYKNIKIYILQVWGNHTPVLFYNRLDVFHMSSKSSGKWMVFPGMITGVIAAALIGHFLPNLMGSASAQQVPLPPASVHHSGTLAVVPTP